jgi:hypothetical protein
MATEPIAAQILPGGVDNALIPAGSLAAYVQLRGGNLHCKKVKLSRS